MMSNRFARHLATVSSIHGAVKRRTPCFAYDYFVGGVNEELCKSQNRTALENVQLIPQYRNGSINSSTKTTIFEKEYSIPFGIGPVGGGDFIWPGAAEALARAAAKNGFLFIPGTMTSVCIETVRKISDGHDWFQLYAGVHKDFTKRTLSQLKELGVRVLVITIDMAAPTYRWREERHNLSYPPNITPRSITDALLYPIWTANQIWKGFPKFPNVERFMPTGFPRNKTEDFIDEYMMGVPSLDGFQFIRNHWDGPIVIKGILSENDLSEYRNAGADGAIISNHGGRQLDAAPATVEVLPKLREAVGDDFVLLVDGQCWTGLDVARYIASGANFVIAGRAPYLSVAAVGTNGAEFFAQRMCEDFKNTLIQLGCSAPSELPYFKCNLANS
ncbi:MAG: alpha-hydroxy acid oxidase [Pseudomonadota bacterium]